MKKETVIAIVFGLVLGGIVALLILFKGKDIELARNKAIGPKGKEQQLLGEPLKQIQGLELTSPSDGTIVDKNSLSLPRKIEKDRLLLIQSPIRDMTARTTSNNFKIDFPLALGENVIKIVAYPKDKTMRAQEKDLKVYFLDSEL